ncbi:MAG: 4Fe-4S dicluster domain-containing protein [Sulfuritalea sp.]|nr:4Fe-4S dicluster domain-containing protein [Sulfuritalea sp.]
MAPGTPVPHDGVVYRSRGSVLIAGDTASAAEAARELVRRAPNLRIALFAPGVAALGDLPTTVKAVGGRIVSLRGHLGRFSASVRVAVDKAEDAGIFSGNADRHFDLVLDLCREPLLQQSVLPHGYYAPGDDATALARALDSLPQLTGDFHKPKYVNYRPQLCAHGAMGVAGCGRCLDVCATQAIRSSGEKIEVDPYLCQGCAGCTLVCPSGALEFQHPAPGTLQALLDERLEKSGEISPRSILVVHDAAARHLLPVTEASGALFLEVNPLPAFSDLMWLKTLVDGVGGLVLVLAPTTPPQSRQLIEFKLEELRSILAELGCDPEVLQIAAPQDVAMAIEQIRNTACPPAMTAPAAGSAVNGKRESLLALIDALGASRKTDGRANAPRALATGAGFGTVLVDAGKCSLCLACTHLCPTGALGGQLDPAPLLLFKESLCIQCDLCRAGCPEQAIALQPRFLPSPAARNAARELASDQLAACSSCGTPFIGRRKLALSLALMREHAKDMPGGIDSLRMCPACRQRKTMLG